MKEEIKEEIKKNIIRLVKESRDAVVCSIDKNGFPNAKAMFIAKAEGIQTLWFSTNVSARRTQQWMEQSKTCLYIVDSNNIHGLMLVGNMEVLTDNETKREFWRQGDEQYYPMGPTDADYCIIRFTTKEGRYWENQNYDIDTEMIKDIK